jgi:predicted DNA-binding transcriptional regulator AlpA|tara:strand:- start:113 stop:334 length:222 start_codon:yes stop_codon:yes gene_type:complete
MTLQAIFEKLEYIETILTGYQQDRFLNTRDVIQLTGLSDSTIRRNVRKGTLKCSKATGKMIFRESDIRNWLSQ